MPGNHPGDIGQGILTTLTHAQAEAILMLLLMLEERQADRADTPIFPERIQIRRYLAYSEILASGELFKSLGCCGSSLV